jgi:hypothetical protein
VCISKQMVQITYTEYVVRHAPSSLSCFPWQLLIGDCACLLLPVSPNVQDFAIITYDTADHARKAITVLDGTKLPSGSTLSLQFFDLRSSLMPDTPVKIHDMPWNPALSPVGTGMYGAGAGGGMPSAFATGLATPPRGSFAGEGVGVIGSGSLFPLAEAGNTGELFSGAFGGNMGGFGSIGSGLRVGTSSPAFGRPPRDGAGPAVASSSALYSPTPLRSGSPGVAAGAGVGGFGGSSPVGRIGSGAQTAAGLPPMYSGSAGIANSASAGSLFGRGGGGEVGIGSDGASATGSDGGHA